MGEGELREIVLAGFLGGWGVAGGCALGTQGKSGWLVEPGCGCCWGPAEDDGMTLRWEGVGKGRG